MLKNIDNYRFEDLFELSEIQKLIDTMSKALNLGLVIVSPEGKWITKPSSRCYFCEKLIKTSKKGYDNCKISDAALGRPNKDGPIIQKCLSAGLMDAGISIFIKDKHIASWIIGQVRIESEAMSEEENIAKALELDIDPQVYCKALNDVPVMTMEQFGAVTDMVSAIAVQLSELGYNNYLQKEQLREKDEAKKELEREKEWFGYIANYDALTGLGSRSYFDDKMQELCVNNVLPCTYVACDVNNLKYTNDIFGHDKGDLVLKSVARILKEEAKDSYIIGRCGGDEINILLPEADENEARDYIRRVQMRCKADRECAISLSVAMGFSRITWENNSYHENIIQADESMYKDKRRIKKTQNLIKEMQARLLEKGYISELTINRTVNLIREFGKYIGIKNVGIERIVLAARIADIGMIAVPASAFKENVKEYNPADREEIMKHTIIGSEIAKMYSSTQRVSKIILHSRETWDGRGYPNKLAGENILLEARVLYLVRMYVVWETKTDRVSRFNESDAITQIKERAGTQFDPKLVEQLLEFLEKTQYKV